MKKRIHDATIVQHAPVLLGAPLVLHKLEGRPEPSRTESEGGTKMGGCRGRRKGSWLPSFKPLDYLNFCRIMIAYLKVIHLFLSLPTPMWFSNPEVITF